MYPGLKTELKNVILNPDNKIKRRIHFASNHDVHINIIVSQGAQEIINLHKHILTTRHIYPEMKKYAEFPAASYQLTIVPTASHFHPENDEKDYDELYSLCEVRYLFEKDPQNKAALTALSHFKQK